MDSTAQSTCTPTISSHATMRVAILMCSRRYSYYKLALPDTVYMPCFAVDFAPSPRSAKKKVVQLFKDVTRAPAARWTRFE